MKHTTDGRLRSVLTDRPALRVAVIGAGMAGLSCARELRAHGHDVVVFEASDRLGGRCSSRQTRIGCFDDAAQAITGATRLTGYTAQRAGELAALHSWTVPATPAEDEPKGKDRDLDADETETSRSLKLLGAVGVPSMLALAGALGRPLDVRLNTPIQQTLRRGARWVLRDAAGEIDEHFQALVLALPAPLAWPLAQASPRLATALQQVRYRGRWVLLLGSERAVGLPGNQEFQGSPIERIAAMHSKPGRPLELPQRWFIEASERWSLQHAHTDAETVADLLLDNFRALASRTITPHFLAAQHWAHAFVEVPAKPAGQQAYLWDEALGLGVCGDSVVASRVDQVHHSGLALAQRMAKGWISGREHDARRATPDAPRRDAQAQAQLACA